jgi:DNA-binding IclR family transcriptional regulator
MSAREGVGVLARAAKILDVIEARPLGASDLARELGLSLSTTHRLAGEMVRHGLLRRGDDGRYHLGHRFTAYVLADLSRPVLRELVARTGESAQLWTRRGDYRLCSASAESGHELRVILPEGTLVPLPAGSAGHVLSGDWERDANAVRRGWWESTSERTPGSASVSAPVRMHGQIAAAICVAGPIERIGTAPGERIGAAVVAAAQRLQETVTAVSSNPAGTGVLSSGASPTGVQ